jgi:protein ImuB
MTSPSSTPSACPPCCYACVYRPPAPAASLGTSPVEGNGGPDGSGSLRGGRIVPLVEIAREFSPRYQRHRDDLVTIDVRGLERLLGGPRTIAQELRREAADRGVRVHVAIAGTQTAALLLALARPGITVIDPGDEAAALAAMPIGILEQISTKTAEAERSRWPWSRAAVPGAGGRHDGQRSWPAAILTLKHWGIRTLGGLAALPSADLASRLGREGPGWQAIARGEDLGPLVPDEPEERFESSLELEWPIEALEPLSFVLTRLLEPLSTRLERRDRGAAVLYVELRLVTRERHASRLELPAPMRDVRTLRTLALLDLESHPPPAATDRVTIVIEPTPGRVVQHTLFSRAHSTPEQLSTLLARLGALMGQDRIGAPVTVDSYRPGAFEMAPFAIAEGGGAGKRMDPVAPERSVRARTSREERGAGGEEGDGRPLTSALRRCRQPVPARVTVEHGRPIRVTTDRRSFAGGTVLGSAGPWRTSGYWWSARDPVSSRRPGAGDQPQRRPVPDTREGNDANVSGVGEQRQGRPVLDTREGSGASASGVGEQRQGRPVLDTREGSGASAVAVGGQPQRRPVLDTREGSGASAVAVGGQPQRRPVLDTREGNGPSASGVGVGPHAINQWNRDEWDVFLSDGAVYRIFRDRDTDGWFIDAIVD